MYLLSIKQQQIPDDSMAASPEEVVGKPEEVIDSVEDPDLSIDDDTDI